MLSSINRIFPSGNVTFIDKPITNHNWFVIHQNNRSYVFYDPTAISFTAARLHYYTGTRAGLFQAALEWAESIGGDGHAG